MGRDAVANENIRLELQRKLTLVDTHGRDWLKDASGDIAVPKMRFFDGKDRYVARIFVKLGKQTVPAALGLAFMGDETPEALQKQVDIFLSQFHEPAPIEEEPQ